MRQEADRFSWGRAFPRGLLVVGGVLVGMLIVEVALRWIDLGYGNRPLEGHPLFHHVHPRSYRFLSHTTSGEYGGHYVAFDEHGLRSNPEPDKAAATDCNVAFLGDSFTEAIEVAWGDSLVGIVSQSSSCDVRNYGVSSYSPILYFLQWKYEVSFWKPDIVIVQLYSNDIKDDEEYYSTALKNVRGVPLAVPGEENRFIRFLRQFYIARLVRRVQLQISWMLEHWGQEREVVGGFVEQRPAISKLTSHLMERLHSEVQKSGAEFVVWAVPSKFRLANVDRSFPEPEFADLWREWCQERDIAYVDLVEPFRQAVRNGKSLFFDEDIHFNKHGHAIAAQEIERVIRSQTDGR